ncbi:hypothetical protein [Microvirga massiliensis]|uniref:hypothetical protein n=1 Tax=Microvirga massiliensis TaxID=1033741 RepID=UPI00062B7430|nr:hypothetical protein [Microvirga massiliensis]
MALRAKIEALHEVDAKHRDLYHATGDGFVLDVEPVDGLSLGKVEKWRAHVEKMLVAEKASAALDAARIDPAWKDYFLAKLTAAAQLNDEGDEIEVEIIDDKGIRRIGSRGEWLTIEGFVAEMKQARPRCFIDDEPNKSQPTSYSGPNPWLAAHRNLTAQGRIIRDNPELARRLMIEAEVDPGSVGSSRNSGTFNGPNPFKRETWNLTQQGELFRANRAAYERMKAEAGAA